MNAVWQIQRLTPLADEEFQRYCREPVTGTGPLLLTIVEGSGETRKVERTRHETMSDAIKYRQGRP